MTSSPSTAKSGGACPCTTARIPHHRGPEGAGRHTAGGGQVHPDLAEHAARVHQDTQDQNGVCNQLDH